MNFKERIQHRISQLLPKDILVNAAAQHYLPKTSKEKISGKLKKQGHVPMVFDLEEWRLAIMAATNPDNPDRTLLLNLYESCELDDHYGTVSDNRILKLQGTPFKLVNNSEEKDDDATKLLQRPWFMQFIKIAMQSIFKGTQLVELWELKDNLELKEITAINGRHVNPHKKWIYKNAAIKDAGWNYNEAPFKDNYIQIGEDDQLGVLSKLAVAILFKKLAQGSWLDYIEKYGVPPRWVITDREDDERFNELYHMMRDMIGNHFAVLRGNEKIEIMPTPGTDAHEVFDKFIERMDAGITKRIMGATGTVDEKAFVGAAKVHQDTANNRHWADKFFLQYIVNEELLPRLVKLSPVYAPLANLSFEWDDAEELSLTDYIEQVSKLSNHFELDVEEVRQKTGMPILKQKGISPTEGTKQPSGGAGVGK